MSNTANIADLKASLRGQLIEPTDAAYAEARALQRHDRQAAVGDRQLH